MRENNSVSISVVRGQYNEINLGSLPPKLQEQIKELVHRAATADHVDEHGSWDFGVDSDRKWVTALSWDLYGVAYDHHDGKLLAVIQTRKYTKKKSWDFANIRKNYFLLGTNEDGQTFAHPVSPNVIHAAIRKDCCPVLALQNWLWDTDYTKVIRQGDIALIPSRAPKKASPRSGTKITLEDSHTLEAHEIVVQDGETFACDPQLDHVPGTHPPVEGAGWYKVRTARRAVPWMFTAPTID